MGLLCYDAEQRRYPSIVAVSAMAVQKFTRANPGKAAAEQTLHEVSREDGPPRHFAEARSYLPDARDASSRESSSRCRNSARRWASVPEKSGPVTRVRVSKTLEASREMAAWGDSS